eukprot:gene14263-biopygen10872
MWPHASGEPPRFVLAVLGRFGGCFTDGQVGRVKNMARVALAAAGQPAEQSLLAGEPPYCTAVEFVHTAPTLACGHWIASADCAGHLLHFDDAAVKPLPARFATTPWGQSHLYAVLYRHRAVPPPPRRPRGLSNPPGRNWCAFNVVLVAIACTWHVLGERLRVHGPVSTALAAVMACVFTETGEHVPVGTLPGEMEALQRLTGLFFAMRLRHVQGAQVPMCEVWGWLLDSLREEDYTWRNVA